jgi:hypothetical protein
MFAWPYVRSHILCTQLVICLLSHFIHTLHLDWPWSEHAHIIPISRMVDFCESHSDHGQTMIPDMNKMRQKTNDKLRTQDVRTDVWSSKHEKGNNSCKNQPYFCETYSPFYVCLNIGPFAHLVYATSYLSFVAFYSYLVSWLAMICVHKMCGRTYGQINMKRTMTLAKINHPWNRYNMRMLRSWPIKMQSMNKMRQICRILFIFGILVGHDLSMRILYRFQVWLIFARVIALFIFVWP